MENEKRIWNWFKQNTEITEIGIAAIMGNIKAESDGIPINLENRANLQLGMTDEQYTEMVDNGVYTRSDFSKDNGVYGGYGLCQWTYYTRKQGLYDFCKRKGTSIGDLESQLEYMLTEQEWKNIAKDIVYATDISKATKIFCEKFENPAVPNNSTRISFAQDIYNRLHGSVVSGPQPAEKSNLQKAIELMEQALNILKEGGSI